MAENRKPPELDGALILDTQDTQERNDAPGLDHDSSDYSDYKADDDFDAAPVAPRRDAPPLNPEDLHEDGKAELSMEMLVEILKRMSLNVDVQIREDGDEVVLDLTGEDAGRVIGKKGQTLDALQFLINKIVNRFPESRRHIVLDSGDYRLRRENGLVSMARREAKRAVQQSRIITLEPMSPRDRRVIHLSLAKFPGVSTRSDGQGTERRVRIIPARQQRGERQPRRERPPQ
ncbi:MAG TPA: KH domain-containing protein [Polyangiales bacterium]